MSRQCHRFSFLYLAREERVPGLISEYDGIESIEANLSKINNEISCGKLPATRRTFQFPAVAEQ